MSLCFVNMEGILSVMAGVNKLQTTFTTSGVLMIVLTLCAALKMMNVSNHGQTILGASRQSCCLLSENMTVFLC